MHLPLFPILLLLPTVLAWGRKPNPDPTEKPLFNSIYTSLDGLPACFAKCFISEDYNSAHIHDVDWHDWCRARFERQRPPPWKTEETLYDWHNRFLDNFERCLKANCREDWHRYDVWLGHVCDDAEKEAEKLGKPSERYLTRFDLVRGLQREGV